MTTLNIYSLLLSLFASIYGWGQDSFISKLYKLEIEQQVGVNYFDNKGKTIGCDWNLECKRCAIVFYSIELNREKGEIRLKGRVYQPDSYRPDSMERKKHGDTVGLFAVHIFLAKPSNKTLVAVPRMSFGVADLDKEGYKQFPLRVGDFDINLKVDSDTRVYFVGYNHVLKEYDIGKLMR